MIYLLHQTIDEAAQNCPEHISFRCESDSVTYGNLTTQANQLAHALIELGVRHGDRVGVLMPRCNQSAVAVHGIMKAGAAFVPLDPRSPVTVLSDLIGFCELKALVTFGQKMSRLEELLAGSKLSAMIEADTETRSCASIGWNALSTFPTTTPPVNVLEHDLAYVMFTSGSTGRPKGIMHTHHSGLSYAKLSVDTYGVQPDDVIGSHSPLHFDMSTFGYFSGPLAAATVSLIPEAYTRLPASLSQLMESHRISIWYSVPFALIQLLLRGALESRDLTDLRWVKFGGEPFPPGHLRELMAQWPHARFSNVYGPAEVNQCTFYHLPSCDTGAELDEPSIPIGRTWPNTSGLVVDEDDAEVMAGQQGELLIRSSTMMQGYWDREDLNAGAFFSRTMSSGIEETYYRTGDLVRENAKGELVFLGRKDRQVKVRGYRVELDAVEQAVGLHAAVEEVGAFVVMTAVEVTAVAAAVTVKQEAGTVSSRDLVTHAKGLLPWYAVPAVVHVLDDLPRTTSGKINRRLLAESFSSELE